MADTPVTLEDLSKIIQRYVAEQSAAAILVSGAMVVWEEVRYADDGTQMRRFGYADVLHSGLATAIGLMVAGQQQVMDDLFAEPEEDDE